MATDVHSAQPSPSVSDGEASVEQRARDLLAAEYERAGFNRRATLLVARGSTIDSAAAIRAIVTALSQQENTKQAVPSGYVLVPIKPTDAMLQGMSMATFLTDRSPAEMLRRYNGMLEALTPADGGSNG